MLTFHLEHFRAFFIDFHFLQVFMSIAGWSRYLMNSISICGIQHEVYTLVNIFFVTFLNAVFLFYGFNPNRGCDCLLCCDGEVNNDFDICFVWEVELDWEQDVP